MTTTASRTAAPAIALRAAGPAILVLVALATLIWGLAYGGGAAPVPNWDVGPVVRWSLPITTLVVNLAGAGMAGMLVTALFTLKAGDRPFTVALDAASISAAVYTIAAAATGYFTFLNVLGAKPSADALFGEQLGTFLIETELGRAWLAATLGGAIVTVLAFAVRTWTPTFFVGVLAVLTLVPVATQGHSGEEANHHAAVMSLVLHVVGAAAWLGGLLLMVVIRPLMTDGRIATALSRYSSLALVAFIVVAISGAVRAVIGVGAWDRLLTPYGVIVLVKVVALLAMGVLGAWYRRHLIARLARKASSRLFWGIVMLELAFMGIASGAAAALASTPPPMQGLLPMNRTAAQILSKAPLPPELTPERLLTMWDFDLLWAFAAGFGLFFYLAAVWRLHRRGDKWPIYRTVLWTVGMLLLFWVTNGSINAYQDYLFSVHMMGHMLLSMAIPMFLVAGAPVTLAARAIRKREDGTRGGREWILWGVHTPFARIITNPYVAAAIFVVSLWVFYFTDVIRWAVSNHIGHQWMVAHFLISGYLFVQSLIGIDPVPYRLPYPFRILLLIAVLAMHAFFGMAIMMNTGLMVAEWYGSMGRPWGPTPMEDQYIGGGIAWSVGEIPALILAITVAIQWSRSDERIQKRRDRHADRTGDAELEAYNAHLAELAERDRKVSGRA